MFEPTDWHFPGQLTPLWDVGCACTKYCTPTASKPLEITVLLFPWSFLRSLILSSIWAKGLAEQRWSLRAAFSSMYCFSVEHPCGVGRLGLQPPWISAALHDCGEKHRLLRPRAVLLRTVSSVSSAGCSLSLQSQFILWLRVSSLHKTGSTGWDWLLQTLAWATACKRISWFEKTLLTQLQHSEGLQQRQGGI